MNARTDGGTGKEQKQNKTSNRQQQRNRQNIYNPSMGSNTLYAVHDSDLWPNKAAPRLLHCFLFEN
jgi:hypothetical protein